MSCPKADLTDCYEKVRRIVEARKGVAWSVSAVIAGHLSYDSFDRADFAVICSQQALVV